MNFEQVLQKASVACFNSGQRIEDHFGDVDEMVLRSRQLGPRRRNVKHAGLTHGIRGCLFPLFAREKRSLKDVQ
jgi:hypothetical protein